MVPFCSHVICNLLYKKINEIRPPTYYYDTDLNYRFYEPLIQEDIMDVDNDDVNLNKYINKNVNSLNNDNLKNRNNADNLEVRNEIRDEVKNEIRDEVRNEIRDEFTTDHI